MDIVINNDSATPIYRQITEQIASDIIQNKLHAHEALPSIRAIALDLKISVITTKKAYEELESMGLIYTLSGVGCFVSEIKHIEVISARNELARKKMTKDLEFYKSCGMSNDEIVELVKSILKR
jgi:GntR family transcriptional regulator